MEKRYKKTNYIKDEGRSRFDIKCPFCGEISTAYVWAIHAHGKECTCGAMHEASGYSRMIQNITKYS